MFSKTFFKKVADDLKEFNEYSPEEISTRSYNDNSEALQKITNNIIWRIKTLDNLIDVTIPNILKSEIRIEKNPGQFEIFYKELENFLNELSNESLNDQAKIIVNVLNKLNNQSKYHLQYIISHGDQKVKELESKKLYEKRLTEGGTPTEEIIFDGQEGLYQPKKSKLTTLLDLLNYSANMIAFNGKKLEAGISGKERFDVLNTVNKSGITFANAVNKLYDYTKANNIKLGKQTWKAKNVVGMLRALVNEQEYVMYLNNINQATKTLYLIE